MFLKLFMEKQEHKLTWLNNQQPKIRCTICILFKSIFLNNHTYLTLCASYTNTTTIKYKYIYILRFSKNFLIRYFIFKWKNLLEIVWRVHSEYELLPKCYEYNNSANKTNKHGTVYFRNIWFIFQKIAFLNILVISLNIY